MTRPVTNALTPNPSPRGRGEVRACLASEFRAKRSRRVSPRSATSPTATCPTALWMMDYLERPLLIEGEAGVGKTEVAKALAAVASLRAHPHAVL